MKNTKEYYGWIAILLHWLVAITVISMFILGIWMVDLGYYDAWRKAGPELHKSIGISLFVVMIFRLIWRLMQIQPSDIKEVSEIEHQAAHWMHRALYLFVFCLMLSGYLISTADNRGIDVFNFFEVPSFGSFVENQEDIAGLIHQYLAYSLIALVALHGLAALKHHFINKNTTMLRMLGFRKNL